MAENYVGIDLIAENAHGGQAVCRSENTSWMKIFMDYLCRREMKGDV